MFSYNLASQESAGLDFTNWDVSKNEGFSDFLYQVRVPTCTYSKLLIKLANENNVRTCDSSNEEGCYEYVSFTASKAKYDLDGEEARRALVERGWTIKDAGPSLIEENCGHHCVLPR